MAAVELDPMRPLEGRARRMSAGLGMEAAAAAIGAGEIVVWEGECAIGGSVNSAIAALREAGCAGVIARSIPEAIVHAATNCGLPALVVDEAPAIRAGDRLRIDIEAHRIANLDSGDRYVIRNIADVEIDVLRAGGLVKFRAVMDDLKRRHGM